MQPTLVVQVAALALAARAAVADCPHAAQRRAALDAAGATRAEIVARAGGLRVTGRAGATRLEVDGRACAPTAEGLAAIQLRAVRAGTLLRVEAQVPEDTPGAALELVIGVPEGLPLQVTDGSGALEIRSVGALELDDASGELIVEDVRGDVRLRDDSGAATLARITGDVRVEDGSGDLDVSDVSGSVDVVQDGSGDVRVARVGGSVHVGQDGSGAIDARDVGGDLRIEHDESGAVRHSGVRGRVSLPARR